jgi:hypothetical protein
MFLFRSSLFPADNVNTLIDPPSISGFTSLPGSQYYSPTTGMSHSTFGADANRNSAHTNLSSSSGQFYTGKSAYPASLQAQQAYFAFLQQSQIVPQQLHPVIARFTPEHGAAQGEIYTSPVMAQTHFGESINLQSEDCDNQQQHLQEGNPGLILLREAYNTLQDEVDIARRRQLDLLQLVMELYEDICVTNDIYCELGLRRNIKTFQS